MSAVEAQAGTCGGEGGLGEGAGGSAGHHQLACAERRRGVGGRLCGGACMGGSCGGRAVCVCMCGAAERAWKAPRGESDFFQTF